MAKINGMSCTNIGVSRRKCLEGQGGHSYLAKYSSPGPVEDLIGVCMPTFMRACKHTIY